MEQDSFGQILNQYRRLLFSLCRRYSRYGLEVEDLMQEVSLSLWKQRERMYAIPQGPQQAAWIWRVARNTAVDCQRRLHTAEPLPEGMDPPTDDHSLIEALHEQIALLPEPDHALVSMHLQGYSYKEIGQQLQMTEKNVSVRLVRIKEKLKKGMAI